MNGRNFMSLIAVAVVVFATYKVYKLIDVVLEYRRVLRDIVDVEERYAEIAIRAIERRKEI